MSKYLLGRFITVGKVSQSEVIQEGVLIGYLWYEIDSGKISWNFSLVNGSIPVMIGTADSFDEVTADFFERITEQREGLEV